MTRRNCCARPGSKVDALKLSSGPGWEIQEVSWVGAQGIASKSKLLALEMLRLHTEGLQVDSEVANSLKVVLVLSGSKSVFRWHLMGLERRWSALLRPSPQPVTSKICFWPFDDTIARTGGLSVDSVATLLLEVASAEAGPKSMLPRCRRHLE